MDRKGVELMSDMATTRTCNKCGLHYYDSLIPHRCAEWTKGVSHEQPASEAGSETSKHPFTESPSSSVTCLTCGKWPSDPAHANVSISAPAAPETRDGSKRYLLSEVEHLLKENQSLIAERERLVEALKQIHAALPDGIRLTPTETKIATIVADALRSVEKETK